MSSQRQRSQAGYWTDVAQQLSEIASSVNYRTEAQLRHRMALVEFWEPAGVFYIVEFHPFAAVFETSEAGTWYRRTGTSITNCSSRAANRATLARR